MPASRPSHTTPYRDLILPFYLPALILAFSTGLLIPTLPLYARSVQSSYGLIGLMLAGEGLGALLGDLPAGMLLRRLGGKRAMALGLGSVLFSTAALYWVQTVPLFIGCRLIAGFGLALYGVARHAYIAATVHVAGRGRALSLLGGIYRIGRFIGPVIGGLVAAGLGLRAMFLVFGATCTIALFSIVAFVHTTSPVSQQALRPLRTGGSHLVKTLRGSAGVLAPAGVGYLFAAMIRAGRTIVVPLYAADVLGLSVETIGLIVGISSAVDMSLFYPAGQIMDHLGRKFSLVPCFAIQAIGMALIPLTGGFWGLLAVTSLIGFGNGLGAGVMMTLGADLAPPDARGEFLGIWRLVGDAGGSGAPLIVGAVAELFVLQTATLVIAGAGLIAAAVFWMLVPETLRTSYVRCASPPSEPTTCAGE